MDEFSGTVRDKKKCDQHFLSVDMFTICHNADDDLH